MLSALIDQWKEHRCAFFYSAKEHDCMTEVSEALRTAIHLLATFDPDLAEIVGRSLQVSVLAVLCAACVGLSVGALLAIARFPGRKWLIVLINGLMGLPPVVVGLLVYLLLSRSGPLGAWGLLFSPTAMIIAQTILVTPIICALSRQVLEDLWHEYAEQLRSLGTGTLQALRTLVWEARYSLVTVVMAGFGRAIGEVGAVLIVGGNIAHVTRVMTTTIALESSRGDLALALALGFILVTMAIAVNSFAHLVREISVRNGY